jgi:hypothetical protein
MYCNGRRKQRLKQPGGGKGVAKKRQGVAKNRQGVAKNRQSTKI